MTSEVMIMNRQAVALAADSAVTYGGGPEPVVTLEAEKILPLTDSIAVMVYSRGDVLGRSWSHIAHAFRKEHGQADFETVDDCAQAFFAFIDKNRRLFPEEEESAEFEDLMRAAFLTVLHHAQAMRAHAGSPYESDEEAFEAALDLYRGHLEQDENGEPRPSLAVFADLTRERFEALFGAMLAELIEDALDSYGAQDEVREKLIDFAYLLATRPAFLEPFAGLVFAGFGSADVFPVYSHYYASILVDGVMKREHDENVAVGVGDGPSAFVRTFAQADMTHAFLRGVHPMMFDLMISMNLVANEAAAEIALREAGLAQEQVEEVLGRLSQGALPNLTGEFIRAVQSVAQEEFIKPFINVVAASGKRQVAETSKALVELNILKTSLHMSRNGVGGEVDVAMITRTAGLEWHARKA